MKFIQEVGKVFVGISLLKKLFFITTNLMKKTAGLI